ncbi:MAG: hypothetical protein LAQ69_23825 [Acidobacteriia bacterium]|nr:hypothetical protein [Terriglobia bacterium]
MSGQFYCAKYNRFLPCEEEAIGKTVACQLCSGTHDAVPAQAGANQRPARMYSLDGLIFGGIFLVLGLVLMFSPGIGGELQWIVVGALFVAWAFHQPLKWWQALLTFVGGGYAMRALLETADPTTKLNILVPCIVALYFGFRRPKAATKAMQSKGELKPRGHECTPIERLLHRDKNKYDSSRSDYDIIYRLNGLAKIAADRCKHRPSQPVHSVRRRGMGRGCLRSGERFVPAIAPAADVASPVAVDAAIGRHPKPLQSLFGMGASERQGIRRTLTAART